MTRTITVQQPMDLAVSLEMGQAFRWRRVGDEGVRQWNWGDPPDPWRVNGGAWYSGFLGGHLVHIRQTSQRLEYRVGSEEGERHDVDLDQQLHGYFRLDDDIGEVYGRLGQHRTVVAAISLYPGLRLLRQNPWECLAAYLCSGANSIRGIRNSVEKIAQLSRRTVYLAGDERFVFPSPVQIADQGARAVAKLELGLSSRSRYIYLMALRLSRDPLLLGRMTDPAISANEAVGLLDSYRGIGPKTAGRVALMSLDKLDAFPVDRWVQTALSQCKLSSMPTGLAERVRHSGTLSRAQQYQVAEWGREYFGEYAGYANQYIFHWIEPRKEEAG